MKLVLLIAGLMLAFSAQAGDETTSPALRAHQAAELAKGDPARWFVPDRTVAQKVRTLQKETAAAHAENVAACKGDKACIKKAHCIYRHEMSTIIDRALED